MTWSPPTDSPNKHVTVVGAGTLGRRVALVWASKGGNVKLTDMNEDAVNQVINSVKGKLPNRVKNIDGAPGTTAGSTNNQEAVRNAWTVIECTPEVAKIKIDLLWQLDSWCDPSTIIATISSSFKSGDLVRKVSESGRSRVLNTHYFQPPELLPVEIMTCGKTDPAIIEFLQPKLREIGLDPVVAAKESTGLFYDRICAAIKREVMLVLAEGVGRPQAIDKLFRYSFQSQGAPCELMDKVGLKTVCDIEEHYIEERGNIPRSPVDFICKNYIDKGKLGVKSGEGLFDHHDDHSKTGRGKQSLRHQLVGAWELMEYSAYPKDNPSKKSYPMTEKCQGIIMYTHTGYMSAQLQIPGQKSFKENDLSGGTEKGYAESGRNYLSYTGPFYLDESGDVPLLQHHMTNCSFPNWLGSTQRRMVNIETKGEDIFLTLGPEGETTVMGQRQISQLVWRRLPENHEAKP